MIRSMTGFGRGEYEIEGRKYIVEIKSVNHKYADISIKLPRFLNAIENNIRQKVANNLSRGKIDVYISFENNSKDGTDIKINKELALSYISNFQSLAEEAGISKDINVVDIIRMPDVMNVDDDEDIEKYENELNNSLDMALDNFVKMREQEGQKLVQDMQERVGLIEEKVNEIKLYSKDVVPEYIEKLKARVKELMQGEQIDENRINQEIVIYSDKSSIEEELTRLDSHISQFKMMLNSDSPIGKKFDFLVQEMNRETNTIGSKANNINITNCVINLKTEIENIREQIQNIE